MTTNVTMVVKKRRRFRARYDEWFLSLFLLASLAFCPSSSGALDLRGRFRFHGYFRVPVAFFRRSSKNNNFHETQSVLLSVRGGAGHNNDEHEAENKENDLEMKYLEREDAENETSANSEEPVNPTSSSNVENHVEAETIPISATILRRQHSRIRHTSDMLQNLIVRSAVVVPESIALRQLISQRSKAYVDDLLGKRHEFQQQQRQAQQQPLEAASPRLKKLPHPKKVLHFLAPKIPAIRQSPDVNLRIQTARYDIDSGIAACLIGTLARVCESYDNEVMLRSRQLEYNSQDQKQELDPTSSAASELVKDRRFEQVVECLLCGVDVKKRKREYLSEFLDSRKKDENGEGASGGTDAVEELIEGEQVVQVQDGLNIRDSCRASWGLAILGAHHCGTLGGTRVMDLLLALSLRIRELLLVRLQMFLQGDLMEDIIDSSRKISDSEPILNKPQHQQLTPEERLDALAEELAEDAATAMWTFACVRACTGMRSPPLFETCCSILCQDPVDLRRRAQEADKDSVIEENDVVDRLLSSEAHIKEEEAGTQNVTTTKRHAKPDLFMKTRAGEEKEALIDWLSPNELTDVLWALALHGHSDTSKREESILSENAGVLKEIAFDRLVELLREDYRLIESSQPAEQESDTELVSTTEEYVTNDGETMTVEVVDAAALLASENAAKAAVLSTVENMTVNTAAPLSGQAVSGIQEVKVVDASAVLEASGESLERKAMAPTGHEVHIDENDDQTERLGEIFTESGENMVGVTVPDSKHADSDGESGSMDVMEQLYFSPHDLCSLAWAVTELQDSLRFQIVDLVINIFAILGEESFDALGGADLSNLAWAVARHSCDARPWSSEAENGSSLQLALWVARRALIASGGQHNGIDIPHHIHILDPFQPPELSRLMWAVASLVRSHADKSRYNFAEIDELALNALLAASSNISMFAPEDLLRILWAFLEVCDMDDALSQPGVASALGRIFSSIETCIVRWERGHNSSKPDEETTEESRGVSNSLTSLFLRPRLSRQILDQTIEEYNDFEEDDERVLASIAGEKKSRLPRLRDLALDPATLAKAACGWAKVSKSHSNLKGNAILTRVTLKLLTSKNGRLLGEFTLTNLVRACEAAAVNEAMGRGEDHLVGHYARRFLQLLNEANNPSNYDEGSKNDLRLSSASPEEVATLLWSLGELGVRHLRSDKDTKSAHRRLRLIMESPLLSDDQLEHLTSTSAMKVLRGLVTLNEMRNDKKAVIKVLQKVEPTIFSMREETSLCELAECLAVIGQSLDDERLKKIQTVEVLNKTVTRSDNATVGKTLNISQADGNQTVSLVQYEENRTESTVNATTPAVPSDHDILTEISTRMLTALATHAAGHVSNLKAESLSRLLAVYSLLPFQADDLVDAFEEEVCRRQMLLKLAASTVSVEDLLRQAADNAVAANTTVFGKHDDESSTFNALKKGLKSIFSSHVDAEDDEASEEMRIFTAEIGTLLQRITAAVTQVDQTMEQITTASNVHTDTALERITEGANFELGRCQELIDNYRRIEFSTGRRQSRYDYERTRDISKRLLSRLIPR